MFSGRLVHRVYQEPTDDIKPDLVTGIEFALAAPDVEEFAPVCLGYLGKSACFGGFLISFHLGSLHIILLIPSLLDGGLA